MKYTVATHEENGLEKMVLGNIENGITASILPEFGALLDGFSIPLNNQDFNIIDNYSDRNNLLGDLAISYKSSKLSPFACRIRNGKYHFNGRDFQFKKLFGDGSAIHGLLYDKPFSVKNTAALDSHAQVELSYHYKNEDEGFPYAYTCDVVYRLANNKLTLKTTVTNKSPEEMPLTDGWHPYFRLGGPVNNWQLRFDGDGIVEFDSALIPTGKILEYPRFQNAEFLGDIELDNSFVLHFNGAGPKASLYNPDNGLRLKVYPDQSYPYLQIYIPPHRNSIAVENLSGAPNCFNNGMGLIVLKPGASKVFTTAYEITID